MTITQGWHYLSRPARLRPLVTRGPFSPLTHLRLTPRWAGLTHMLICSSSWNYECESNAQIKRSAAFAIYHGVVCMDYTRRCCYNQVMQCCFVYIYTYVYMSHRKNPAKLNMYWTDIGLWKLIEIVKKTHGTRWDLLKLAIPLIKVMSLYFSNIHISDTQIGRWCLWIIYIYKCSSFLQAIPPKFTIYHYCTNVW